MLNLRVFTCPRVGRFCPTHRDNSAPFLMNKVLQIPILFLLLAGATHAAVPVFSALLGGSGQDYAAAVASDAQGNTYVVGLTYSPDFPVTTGAVQTKFGGTSDAFVTKLGPDGKRIWSTYLGGILDDAATGVALDKAGNVLVTGTTRSANFPVVNAIQNILNTSTALSASDAFVAKLDPTGGKLLYSTFLGGPNNDGAAGIAVDAANNAYVAVSVISAVGFPGLKNPPDQSGIVITKLSSQGELVYSFFHLYGTAAGIAVDSSGSAYVAGTAFTPNPTSPTQTFGAPGTAQAMVFKVAPDGSKRIFETTLGGTVRADGAAVAVDSTGAVYVAGSTSSADFPTAHALQSTNGARPLWKSLDSGATWVALDNLLFAVPQVLVVDPTAPKTVYAATGDLGMFKSVDGGVTWSKSGTGITGTNIAALAIDLVHPQTLFAADGTTVYQTVNGGSRWTAIDTPPAAPFKIVVDPQNSNIVWQVGTALRKSTDGGATWKAVAFPGSVQFFALDPRVSGNIVAASTLLFCGIFCTSNQTPFIYHSTDGGATWTVIPSVPPFQPGFLADGSTNPTTVYDGLSYRSTDGGVTWSRLASMPSSGVNNGALTVDPAGTLYTAFSDGIFVSHDHAETWTAVSSFGPGFASMVPAGTSGTLYAAVAGPVDQKGTTGFVTKLSADGASIVYSTYLGGHASTKYGVLFAAEPHNFNTQAWISSIMVDAAGNATVAGGVRSTDLPMIAPSQAFNAGLADAFAATLSADGAKLTYSTYFGGSQDDGALAAAMDSQGNIILAGQTWSGDFPIPGGVQPPTGFGEAFVVKLSTAPPSISTVVNGASFLPGIAPAAWVTIKGTNLANTFPGRIWRDEEVVNGKLPTSLDGVSVTIDGKPAFVYYISPTQINVQAPSGLTLGSVNVVVNNNGALSAPATAEAQAVAPAFFQDGATNYAVATRSPDFTLLADPSAVPGSVPAKPGDIVVLWATGFGSTLPEVQAGITVTGAPAALALPSVTVAGLPAQVIGVALSPGSAGMYQIAIQLPDAVPTGNVSVRATVGGVQTQAGALLFVAKP
jgi:uncharacterized protein (TIGR03437 family)